VRNLAFAIAEGQLALDRSAVDTLRFLLQNNVDIVPEVTEIIEPVERQVQVQGQTITVTGANIRASGAAPITLSLLQAGLLPTFYQFTEAHIEVKLSISITRDGQNGGGAGGAGGRLAARPVRAFASPVNYRTSNTYSYKAEGASVMRATLRPVPLPPRLVPSTRTVNLFTSPPTVTVTE
jgi:hypothetical protein